MRDNYGESVKSLKPNEVFVFGSNKSGFHGAGAAGFASFGRRGNVWREEGYGDKPDGWKGKWNVKGVAEGLQEGIQGRSYAIPTVTRAGMKRSLGPAVIIEAIRRMYEAAREHPEWRFLMAGSEGPSQPLNGYSHGEMSQMYVKAGPIPENVIFSASYTRLIFGE